MSATLLWLIPNKFAVCIEALTISLSEYDFAKIFVINACNNCRPNVEHINRIIIITILVALNVICDNNEPLDPNNAATDSTIILVGDSFLFTCFS